MSKLLRMVLVLGVLGAAGVDALAEGGKTSSAATQPAATTQPAVTEAAPLTWPGSIMVVGGCIGAALCVIGGTMSIARIGAKCIDSMARQPETAGTMFTSMIVAAAMVEGGMLFGIVVCMMAVMK